MSESSAGLCAAFGEGIRVIDPLDPNSELSPADVGYGETTPERWGNR